MGLATTKEQADKFQHVTHRRLIAPPGKYTLQFKGRFGLFQLKDGKGEVLAPLDGDQKGEFITGVLQITFAD